MGKFYRRVGAAAATFACLIRRSKRPVRADGSFSAADAAQLRQFQRSVGLARTGVVFYSPVRHVAIYAGNGKVIHASSPGKPVEDNKMAYMPYAGTRRIA